MTSNLTKIHRRRTGPIKIRHKRQESIRAHIESLFLAVRGWKDPVTSEWQGLQLMKHLCAAVLSLKGRLDHDAVVSMSAGSVSRTGNTVIHVTHCPAWPLMHECLAESDQGFRPLVTGFDGSQRRHTFEELVTRYNAIIEACETDPSLKIEVA